VATHDFDDDDPSNDDASTTVAVNDPSAPTGVHVGDLDAITSDDGVTWSAIVEVAVHSPSHVPVNGATVVGTWSYGAFASDTCTTGEGGGIGTCIFLNTLLPNDVPSVTFTVTSVTMTGEIYQPTQNHNDDGDGSDGTSVTAQSPGNPNDPPAAQDVTVSGNEDAASVPWAPSVSDPNGDPLTCSIVTQPSNGVAGVAGDCSAGTYRPDPNFHGLDPFTYSVSDASLADQGTVTVTVNPVNDAPVANGDAYDATAGLTLSVPASGVLANDSDPDGDALMAVLDSGPSNASSFTLNADGSFSYTSATAGNDSFTYHAADGNLDSGVVTVSIAVSAPPVGVTITSVQPNSTAVGTSVSVTISGSGFASGATVSFENGSGPSPTASGVVVVNGQTITATFTARSGGPRRTRVWDVRVTNPDGTSAVLAGGFTVTP
jgi:hypothetical protein